MNMIGLLSIPAFTVLAGLSWAQPPSAAPEAAPKDAAPTVQVERIVTAAGVADREPVGESKSFDKQTPKVFCWVKLLIPRPPAKIRFVWARLSGSEWIKDEYKTEINLPTARWWSSRNVSHGVWKVSVESEDGNELASADFEVGKHKYVLDP